MKTYTAIFEDATSPETVFTAWDEFRPGKRKKADVQQFGRHVEDNLLDLYDDLISGSYTHDKYTAFYVKDPKIRRIHKATVRDRVVHHLLHNILNPIFEPTFISDSYSCRVGKGTHRGVQKLASYARKVHQTYGKCWVLKCDIRKFFDTVDHDILLFIIRRRIKDAKLLWLVEEIVKSYVTTGSRERERESKRRSPANRHIHRESNQPNFREYLYERAGSICKTPITH